MKSLKQERRDQYESATTVQPILTGKEARRKRRSEERKNKR